MSILQGNHLLIKCDTSEKYKIQNTPESLVLLGQIEVFL